MNKCFIIGKICSEIKFEFILNSKDISVAIFNIRLSNGSIITVKGYNQIADYCYIKLNRDMYVLIEGYINSNMEIVLDDIDILLFKENIIS